jgi:hypothetical protein
MADGTRSEAPGGESAARTESFIDALHSLLQELPGLVSDRVELFALELGRAGSALARIVAWVVAIAILGVTAWLALWAGVVIALVGLGLHWTLALLPVLLINLVAVMLALKRVQYLVTRLSLPATRRHLTLSPRATPPSASAPNPHDGHAPGS